MTITPADTHEQTTQESAAALIASGYEAFAAGDVPAVLAMFAEDISWHISGRSPLAGVYTGRDGVLDFFGSSGSSRTGRSGSRCTACSTTAPTRSPCC